MIVLDLICDICGNCQCFSMKTKIRKVRKHIYRINGKDYCSNCVTLALLNIGYIPYDSKLIERNLTDKEKNIVHKFYDNEKKI